MKFILDENIDRIVAGLIEERGYEAILIVDIAPGINDLSVLAKATDSNAVLITQDRDFGELVFKYKKLHIGVILNRLRGLSSDKKANILMDVIDEYGERLKGRFMVVEPNRVRFGQP
ncbi:MAG: DUF5615 family PIN-like protein [Bacteroidota bacterium]